MNEDAEGKTPKQVLQESRAILQELSERNNSLIDQWNRLAQSFKSGPGEVRSDGEISDASSESIGVPIVPEFGKALLQTFSEYTNLWEALIETRGELEAISHERASLQSEVARFSEQVMLLGRSRAEATEEKQRLERELEEATKASEENQVAIQYLKNQVEKLEKNLETLSHEVADREVEKQADTEAIENLKAEAAGIRQEKDELQAQVVSLEGDLEGVRSLVAPLREENLRLTNLLSNLQNELSETKNSTVPASDFGRTKQELESIRAERSALEEQGKTQIEKILKMEGELTVLRSKSQQDEIERLNAEKSLREAEMRIRKMESENQDLKDLLEKATREFDLQKRMQFTGLEERGSFGDSFEGTEADRHETDLGETIRMEDDDLSIFDTDPSKVESLALAEDTRIFEGEEDVEVSSPKEPSSPEAIEEVSSQEEPILEPDSIPEEEEPETVTEPPIVSSLDEDEIEHLDLAAKIEMPLDTGGNGYPDLVQESESGEDLEGDDRIPQIEEEEDSTSYLPEMTETAEEFRSVVEGDATEAQAPDIREDESLAVAIEADAARIPPPTAEEMNRPVMPPPREDFQAIEVAPAKEEATDVPEEVPDSHPVDTEPEGSPQVEEEEETPSFEEEDLQKERSIAFPYPEITGVGMEGFRGRRILLVGGDERFRSDYEHLFGLAGAGLVYFPGIVHLEKNGIKRHVRESDVVVIFGAAVDEPGVFRLRNVASDYGRYLVEHRSSGLVSLYHQLQEVNRDL